MSEAKLFENTSISSFYVKYRPKAAAPLANIMVDYLKTKVQPPFKLAVDVGCGSGQSTAILAPDFEKVLGIDVSSSQIEEANKINTFKNVEYGIGSCTAIPVKDSTVELITVSQAAHWFDLPAFFKEVDRVLKPGGVMAIYVYQFPVAIDHPKAKELNNFLREIYRIDTAGYWNEKRTLVDDRYKNIVPPYEDSLRNDSYFQDVVWSVADIMGYVQSWSGFQALRKENPIKAKESLENFKKRALEALGTGDADEAKAVLRFDYSVLMTRKPLASEN